MTDQRDLKRRVRERMAKTGESYTTARKHILDQRAPPPLPPPSAMEVIEPIDLTEPAERLGFKCRVAIFPALAARIDTAVALTRLRDALLATEEDPATRKLRASALRGELPPGSTWRMGESHDDLCRFVTRAAAGLGGVSPGGMMIALHIDAEIVLCVLSRHRSARDADPQPQIWLHSISESIGTLKIAGLLMR